MSALRGYLIGLLDSEPMVVVASSLAVLGLGVSAFGPRIRDGLGLDTTQYYGRSARTKERDMAAGLTWTKEELGMKPVLKED